MQAAVAGVELFGDEGELPVEDVALTVRRRLLFAGLPSRVRIWERVS